MRPIPWNDLKQYPGLSFHVVVDSSKADTFREALPPFINIYGVPESFRAKFARHKARALE